MSSDDEETARLRAIIERPEERTMWGESYTVTPLLIREVFGDGKMLLILAPICSRPNYFVVRVDSTMPSDGPSSSELDAIVDAAEDEYGAFDEDDEDNCVFPVVEWNYGCSWSKPFPIAEWKPAPSVGAEKGVTQE